MNTSTAIGLSTSLIDALTAVLQGALPTVFMLVAGIAVLSFVIRWVVRHLR